MLLLYLIMVVSLIFYARFFIINSLQTKLQRSQTFNAAIRAIYFIPVFQQALFLLCISLIYFYTICRGFFVGLTALVFPARQFEPDFLFLISFIGIAALCACFTFILAKISMNKKMDAVNVLYKIGYLLFAVIMEVITYLNLPLLYPSNSAFAQLAFYNDPYVIVLGCIIYLIVLLLSFLSTTGNKFFRYIRLSVQISTGYFVLNFILAILVFVLFLLLKLTP